MLSHINFNQTILARYRGRGWGIYPCRANNSASVRSWV